MVSEDELKKDISADVPPPPEDEEEGGEEEAEEESEEDAEGSEEEKTSKWGKFKGGAGTAGRGAAKGAKAAGRGAKAVGRGVGKAGKAAGKWLAGAKEKKPGMGKAWWITAIIFLLIGTVGGYILAWTMYGFIIGAIAFFITILFKKFKDKFQGTNLYFVVIIILIIGVCALGYFAWVALFSGTGFAADVSYYAEDTVQLDAENRDATFAGIGRWWFCNTNPGACVEADKIIDGGIFFKNVGTDFTFSEGDAIEVNGNLDYEIYDTGISSAGKEEKEAAEEELDFSQKNVTVYTEWQDKDYLRDVWTCQQPQGAKSDFTCWYDAGVIKNMRAKDLCGIDFVGMRKTAAGTMRCKADVSVNYYSKTQGFRQLVLSNYPQDIDWTGEGATDYLWSGAGPVIVTIGSHSWNTAVRPAVGRTKTIPVKITPDIKLKEKTYVKPAMIVIAIQKKDGITVTSDDCEVSVDEASKVVICAKTSDFSLDEIDKTTVDGMEIKIQLAFDEDLPAYSESLKLEIWADFEYDVITTESATVDITYNMADTDLQAAQANSTLADHGCGYDASCMERVFKKTDTCAEPVCRATTTKLFGKRTRCICFSEDFPIGVFCCNGISCALALTGTFSQAQQNSICETFDVDSNVAEETAGADSWQNYRTNGEQPGEILHTHQFGDGQSCGSNVECIEKAFKDDVEKRGDLSADLRNYASCSTINKFYEEGHHWTLKPEYVTSCTAAWMNLYKAHCKYCCTSTYCTQAECAESYKTSGNPCYDITD